uniref:RalBP1-associated Eps domain-containing protein 2 n=1 Tax=Cacopsylla melanoneura TaxID=428564 RepID=A0A8D9BVT8_9HEMI
MEDLNLSQTEVRYYNDLFTCCDPDLSTGTVKLSKVTELFETANLSFDSIRKILDLSIINDSSSFARPEFYRALKLIASHQAGHPISPDTMTSTLELPLPKFQWMPLSNNKDSWKDGKSKSHNNEDTDGSTSNDLIQLSDNTHSYQEYCDSTDSDSKTMRLDSMRSNGGVSSTASPTASSTASESPTPTNSVHEKNYWQGLVCEEQRQLLGTEEESSDRHSSDGEDEHLTSVWSMSDEQRDYYRTQFQNLQRHKSSSDPTYNLISGQVARKFFENSKLPVQELRKIWQLSDMTKDGALSLPEFSIAMHLVVIRRNNIPLPDVLPPSLLSSLPSSPVPSTSSPSGSLHKGKEWTKFVDSPTSIASNLSSPGPKPVNFDFQKAAVEQDPKILHPVPLRVTPNPEMNGDAVAPAPSEVDSRKTSVSSLEPGPGDIRPIQRPQPKKPSSSAGVGAIPPPPQTVSDEISGPTSLPVSVMPTSAAPKKEPPPPPPPRPRTHARSSSLDLNRLGQVSVPHHPPSLPPMVPPRTSPSSSSPKKQGRDERDFVADFAQFSIDHHGGAFQKYKRPNESTESNSMKQVGSISPDATADARQDYNTRLRKICHELQHDLVTVREERIALQMILDKLHHVA